MGGERAGRAGRRKHNEAIVTDDSETKSTDEPLMVYVSHGGGSKIDWYLVHEAARSRAKITERCITEEGAAGSPVPITKTPLASQPFNTRPYMIFTFAIGGIIINDDDDDDETTYLFQRVSRAVQRYNNSVAFRGTFSVPTELD